MEHPLIQARNYATKILAFLETEDFPLGLTGVALAFVLADLLDLAPDDECRCYLLMFHFVNARGMTAKFNIDEEAGLKQVEEIENELREFSGMSEHGSH